jgi:hypothetical protein
MLLIFNEIDGFCVLVFIPCQLIVASAVQNNHLAWLAGEVINICARPFISRSVKKHCKWDSFSFVFVFDY